MANRIHTQQSERRLDPPCFHGCLSLIPQMELQDDGVMLGLDSSLGKDIVGIINNVFQAPWGGSHTCQKDEKGLECSLCQSSILCYQLGCELLERLTPREEIRLVVRDKYLCDKHTSSWPAWVKQVEVWGERETLITANPVPVVGGYVWNASLLRCFTNGCVRSAGAHRQSGGDAAPVPARLLSGGGEW